MAEASEPRPYRRGVGVVLINAQGLVFAGRRIDLAVEAWQMPQGGVDPGEHPEAAARRELAEEIGTANAEVLAETAEWLAYELPPERQHLAWGGRYRGQMQKWFAMRFLGTDAEIDLAAGHAEFSTWRWLSSREILAAIVPFKHALYTRVFDEFRDYLAEA